MALPEFNQANVDAKIAEIKALPDQERRTISDEVKADLRAWLLRTFTFTPFYEERMAMWPASMRAETGFGIGTALLDPEWELKVTVPDVPNPLPPRAKKTEHEQKVEGSYSSDGTYRVSKSHTWSW